MILTSCVEKRETLAEEKTDNSLDTLPSYIYDGIEMSEGRNIVFILDGTCSVCIAKYATLCKALESKPCEYDSLITVVNGWNDMMVADYNLKMVETKRPEREKVIYDKDYKLSNSLYNISENNCLMIFEKNKLIYTSTMPNI